ncbi:MAG: hypothetical protein ACYS14_03760 [Planctomycetota bacterium]|jgi:hypothetical protein
MKTRVNRSKQTPHESTAAKATQYTPEINQSKSEQQSRMWSTMRWFDGIDKTEEAFCSRFKNLPDEDVAFLKSFYNIGDDRDLFRMVCKFWNIRVPDKAHSTRLSAVTAPTS